MLLEVKTKNAWLTIYRTKVLFFRSYFLHFLQKLNRTCSDAQGKPPKNISTLLSSIFQTLSLLEKIYANGTLAKLLTALFAFFRTLFFMLWRDVKNTSTKNALHGTMTVVNFLATSLKAINRSSLYAYIPGFRSPSIITGDELQPDLLLKTNNNSLNVLELTVGFETNLAFNSTRKKNKYATLLSKLKKQFKSVYFVNLSISALGIFSNSCTSFLKCATPFPLNHNIDASSSPNFPL